MESHRFPWIDSIQPLNPFSISRLIASEREGLGSGWRSIQAVMAASIFAGMRTVTAGSLPVAGRPRGLFSFSAIDPLLFLAYQ